MVKIAICGAGIAGLSTYLLLQKHLNDPASPSGEHEIIIYEAYDVQEPILKNIEEHRSESTPTPQSIGGGIGISKNGLNVLSRMEYITTIDKSVTASDETNSSTGLTGLNSGLIKEIARRGHPIERWEISTARGWTIADVNLIPRDSRDSAPGGKNGDPSASAAGKKPYMYHSVMISRKACWEILRDRVLGTWPNAVVKKRVVHVSIGDATTPNIIKFEDGTEDSVDLLIGADGLRSVVRKVMFEDDNQGPRAVDVHKEGQGEQSWAQAVLRWIGLSRPSKASDVDKSSGSDYATPRYEGLVGVGGFVPSSLLESTGHKPGTMSIVFGPNGFFGYGYLTSAESRDPTADQAAGGSRADAKPNDITDSKINTETSTSLVSSPPISRTSQPGPVAGWWSTFSSKTPYPYTTTTNSNTTSNSTPGSARDLFNKPLAVAGLLARHKKWKNPTISAIANYVESCETTTTTCAPHFPTPSPLISPTIALEASYPTWTTPELPHWTLRGRAALVGDAAHALQPSSGQGACQALEDAEALALLLGWHLQSSVRGGGNGSPSTSPEPEPDSDSSPTPSSSTTALATALAKALKQYETLRMPRLHAIYERSQKMSRMKGDMGFLMEWTMYLMIYLMSWFHDGYNDVLFGYDLPAEVEEVISRDVRTGKRDQRPGV